MHVRGRMLAGVSQTCRSRFSASAGEDRKHHRLVQRTLDAMASQVGRRPYVRQIPRTRWFFRHPRYMRYMAREVTCIFIGIYTILLLIGVVRLAQAREAYEGFLESLQSPAWVLFHIVALGFAAYHS